MLRKSSNFNKSLRCDQLTVLVTRRQLAYEAMAIYRDAAAENIKHLDAELDIIRVSLWL
jgi:hypothetical protein